MQGALVEVSELKFVWYCAMANKRAERERRKQQDFRLLKGRGEECNFLEKFCKEALGEVSELKFVIVQGMANKRAERERA